MFATREAVDDIERLSWQSSLFSEGHDETRPPIERINLDGDSWVDFAPAWLSSTDAVFDHLLHTLRWEQREMAMFQKVVWQPRLSGGRRSCATAVSVAGDRRSIRAFVRPLFCQSVQRRTGQRGVARRQDRRHVAGAARGHHLHGSNQNVLPSPQARRGDTAVHRHPWRSPRHGRQMPARLGALGAENRSSRRPSDQLHGTTHEGRELT